MNIYVDFEKPDSLKEFLVKFFSGPAGSNRGFSVHTYSNKGLSTAQCAAGKNRSLNDLYDCVTTYFPDVTMKDVMKELVTLSVEGFKVTPVYCWMIKKHVISFGGNRYGRAEVRERTGEFTWSEYKDILEEAGISVNG